MDVNVAPVSINATPSTGDGMGAELARKLAASADGISICIWISGPTEASVCGDGCKGCPGICWNEKWLRVGIYQAEHHRGNLGDRLRRLNSFYQHRHISFEQNALLVSVFSFVKHAKSIFDFTFLVAIASTFTSSEFKLKSEVSAP